MNRTSWSGSWVIVDNETGKPLVETWDKAKADMAAAANPQRYRVVPIREWLSSLSKSSSNP